MQIKETHEQKQIRLNRLDHAQTLLRMINQDRLKAKSIFDTLAPGQKKILLWASGVSSPDQRVSSLSSSEIEKLSKGLTRLKVIIKAFESCTNQDFTTPQQKVN